MILEVCNHFVLSINNSVFEDHEMDLNANVEENERQIKLMKWTSDKYFTMPLYTYEKHFGETVAHSGIPSAWHKLNKLILFRNQWLSKFVKDVKVIQYLSYISLIVYLKQMHSLLFNDVRLCLTTFKILV